MGYLEESAKLLASPAFENSVPYMYLDSAGYVTVGVGEMIPSAAAAARYPFQHPHGKLATGAEIEAEFNLVNSGDHHERPGALVLSNVVILELLRGKLQQADADLHSCFSNFEQFPKPAKLALLDMRFNLGRKGFHLFHKLIASVKLAAHNPSTWKRIARQCHRIGPDERRNTWTADQFTAASMRPKALHAPSSSERPVSGAPALPVHPSHSGSYRRTF